MVELVEGGKRWCERGGVGTQRVQGVSPSLI